VWVAGVDGCRAGWFVAARETRTAATVFRVAETAGALLALDPLPSLIGIDVPIGLPDAGRRTCDERARALLGWPRRSSGFPAPIRSALRARTREEASRITARPDGRKVGAQAWGIYAKVREIDDCLERASARERLREVHPEVSFLAWNGGRALAGGKKTAEGHLQRLSLAEAWLGRGILAEARGERPKKDVADDDLLDAIAALWTATRIARGVAKTLPESAPLDGRGRRMEIVY
jgi:predicted RNase H-like nuclease